MRFDRSRPAGQRRSQRATRWRRGGTTLDGTRRGRRRPASHARGPAGDARRTPADGGAASAGADGAAQHAEHAAARRHARRRGGHGPSPGAELSTTDRWVAATSQSRAAVAAQRHRAAAARGAGPRLPPRPRLDPSVRPWRPSGSGWPTGQQRTARRGRSRSHEACAGAHAGSAGIQRRPRRSQQARKWIRHEARAVPRSGWCNRRRSTPRHDHAARSDRHSSGHSHDEALVSQPERPRRWRRARRRKSSGPSWPR